MPFRESKIKKSAEIEEVEEVKEQEEEENHYDQKALGNEIENFQEEIKERVKAKAKKLGISKEKLIDLADLDLESLEAEKLKLLNLKQGELEFIRDSVGQAINEFQKSDKPNTVLKDAPSIVDKIRKFAEKHKKVVSIGQLTLYLSSYGAPVLNALADNDVQVKIEGKKISLWTILSLRKSASLEEFGLEIYKLMGGKEIPPDLINLLGYGYLPKNYQDYITPDDPKVKEYAEKNKIEFILNVNPPDYRCKLGEMEFPSEIKFEYKTDEELLGGEDVWQKPSEYFGRGGAGDCDDYAIAMASIFEAKGYRTKMVCGYMIFEGMPPEGHWNTEIYYEGKYFVMDVRYPGEMFDRDYFNQRIGKYNDEWKPLGMFGKDAKLSVYEEEWKGMTNDSSLSEKEMPKKKDSSDFVKQEKLREALTTYDPKLHKKEQEIKKVEILE